MHLKDMKEKLTFDGDGENPQQWYKLFPNMTSCGNGIADLKSIIETAKKEIGGNISTAICDVSDWISVKKMIDTNLLYS